MGQYFVIVNLDKKEFMHPWDFGTGAKLVEICTSSFAGALPFLLRQSNEGGGGDIYMRANRYRFVGRWAGDRITVIGDYDESGLYDIARRSFTNISEAVKAELDSFAGRATIPALPEREAI